jgi:hypothetical protein
MMAAWSIVTALETRFDDLATLATKADVEALRAEMRADLQKTNADIQTWALATMIAIIGTVLAGLIGISQFYRNTPPPTKAPINLTLPSA